MNDETERGRQDDEEYHIHNTLCTTAATASVNAGDLAGCSHDMSSMVMGFL